MSGKLQSGEVSSAKSYEGTEYDMPSTDTECQADENGVALVPQVRSDLTAPRTRSQSIKLAETCAPPLPQSNSMFSSLAASSRDNGKRCNEDNHQPIQKRLNQRVDNGPADELQDLNGRFRQEREYVDNRFKKIIQCVNDSSDGMRDLHYQFKQHREYIDLRFAEERKKFDRKVDALKVKMSKAAKREEAAAEKITDDAIKGKWETLRYNIRSVVLMLRSYEPKDTEYTLRTLRLRISGALFANLPEEYFRDIFEGYLELYIWMFVYRDIFSGFGRQWRGNLFQLFQTARREAIHSERDPKKIAEFASWFSQGGEAITSQLEQERQQPMADEFAESIFAMFQPHPKPTLQAQIQEVLGVVIYDATELAKMFVSSKALLFPVWPYQKGFNRDWSDTDFEDNYLQSDKCNDRSIELRPALVKYGNADGERHDVSVILCKPARLHF